MAFTGKQAHAFMMGFVIGHVSGKDEAMREATRELRSICPDVELQAEETSAFGILGARPLDPPGLFLLPKQRGRGPAGSGGRPAHECPLSHSRNSPKADN